MQNAQNSIFDTPLRRNRLSEGIWLGRNWHVGSDPMKWSRALVSSLLFDAETFPEPVGLAITVAVFNATPESPRTLLIESPGHASIEVEISQAGFHSVLVQSPLQAPDAVETAGAAEMLLTLDSIGNPLHLGQSADTRWLGLSIGKAIPVPWHNEPPDRLDFGQPEIRDICLGVGWGEPDPEGVWSVAPCATLSLPACLARPGREICFDLAVLPRKADTDAADPLEVAVSVNGEKMTTWRFELGTGPLMTCRVPASWTSVNPLNITFTFKRLRTPYELGINEDPRLLGVFLREVVVAQGPW